MISRFLLLVPSFTKKEGLNFLFEIFNDTQVFPPMYSMLYTVNLGSCDYVPFSQIRSHIIVVITGNTQVGVKEIFSLTSVSS